MVVIYRSMELSWTMKLRIAAACGVGVLLIGFLAWPLAAPADPMGAVTALTPPKAVFLAILAFIAALIAYFVAWPYGRQIGVFAVPAGLAVWAIRSGNMAQQIQMAPDVADRMALFAAVKWEPIFWLAIIAAGFAGVIFGQTIFPQGPKTEENQPKPSSKLNGYLSAAIAIVASVMIAQFCIGFFAKDITIPDNRLGFVTAQPAIGQIIFAVVFSFGLAGFVAKKFLNASYFYPIIASAFVTAYGISAYVKQDIVVHLAQQHPAVFFSNPLTAVLPVQIIAFGAFGAIAGYWSAVRYDYWRKHEI